MTILSMEFMKSYIPKDSNTSALVTAKPREANMAVDIEKALEDARYMFDDDASEELKTLHDLAGEASASVDWPHGEALINKD